MSRPNGSNSDWTPDMIAVVKQWWGNGKNSRQIGDLIGKSNHSVVSKARRLGLRTLQSAGIRSVRPATEPPMKSEPVRPARPVTGFEAPRASTCQWLDGDPSDRNFCGTPVLDGSSYCAEHHERCWRDPRDYRSEAA